MIINLNFPNTPSAKFMNCMKKDYIRKYIIHDLMRIEKTKL